jgi:hypothetical protein
MLLLPMDWRLSICIYFFSLVEQRFSQMFHPFSMQDFKQIKNDQQKFSDYPGKYIEVSQVFDLTWKDVMLIPYKNRMHQTRRRS